MIPYVFILGAGAFSENNNSQKMKKAVSKPLTAGEYTESLKPNPQPSL